AARAGPVRAATAGGASRPPALVGGTIPRRRAAAAGPRRQCHGRAIGWSRAPPPDRLAIESRRFRGPGWRPGDRRSASGQPYLTVAAVASDQRIGAARTAIRGDSDILCGTFRLPRDGYAARVLAASRLPVWRVMAGFTAS